MWQRWNASQRFALVASRTLLSVLQQAPIETQEAPAGRQVPCAADIGPTRLPHRVGQAQRVRHAAQAELADRRWRLRASDLQKGEGVVGYVANEVALVRSSCRP